MKHTHMSWLIVVLALVAIPVFARGSHEKSSTIKDTELRGFTRIQVSAGISVDIKQSKDFSVQATGDSEALDALDMRVRGEVLHIGYKRGLWGFHNVRIDIGMPILETLAISGGSAVTLDFDATKTGSFKASLAGGSRLEGILLTNDLTMEISGGSRVAIEGYGESLVCELSGGSRFDCTDWAVDTAVLELSGGAYAVLAVQTTLTIEASGGSSVQYRGNPKISKRVSGGGKVSALK